jgi:hypothetical protein
MKEKRISGWFLEGLRSGDKSIRGHHLLCKPHLEETALGKVPHISAMVMTLGHWSLSRTDRWNAPPGQASRLARVPWWYYQLCEFRSLPDHPEKWDEYLHGEGDWRGFARGIILRVGEDEPGRCRKLA